MSQLPPTAVPRWAPRNPVFMTRTASFGVSALWAAFVLMAVLIVLIVMLIAWPILIYRRRHRG